jgi:hypothetical protein
MRIHTLAKRFCRHCYSRLLSARLERLGLERGPASFRSSDFLATEIRLGLNLAELARIEYELNHPESAGRAQARAEQIHLALWRFLPHAVLDDGDRAALNRRLERLTLAMARLGGLSTAA